MTTGTAARVAALLFVVTAALFVVGVATEPDGHDETAEVVERGEGAHDEEAEGASEEAERGEGAHDEQGEDETVLGVDVESPGAIAGAVIVSALLAIALWSRPLRVIALVALAIGLGFAMFDVAEVAHQLDENRNGLALLAGVVAAGHATAALLSGRVAWNRT